MGQLHFQRVKLLNCQLSYNIKLLRIRPTMYIVVLTPPLCSLTPTCGEAWTGFWVHGLYHATHAFWHVYDYINSPNTFLKD